MIIHCYKDGSEGLEYEIGDKVIVEKTIHGGWFDFGPTHSECCVVQAVETRSTETWHTAILAIKYSDEWGPDICYPWGIRPHPETYETAKRKPA